MRLPELTELSPRQQEISDRITSRRGGTRGPFLVWLRSPELCEKVEALGAYCRFESSLDLRLRELSLLVAARHWDAQYSWNAHVNKAVDAGVPAEALAALAEHREPRFGREDEQVVYQFSTEILGGHFVSDATFARALAELGEQGVVDLIGSLGNFSMLAMLLNACQVDLQPVEPPFPDVRGYARVPAVQAVPETT
jgi:4-carboxymuconolactone decarboxylase